MVDPRERTKHTLRELDRWLLDVERTTSAIRLEVARLAPERSLDDARDSEPDEQR